MSEDVSPAKLPRVYVFSDPHLGRPMDLFGPRWVDHQERVRHILDVEDPAWLLREDVRAGLGLLQERGLAFDLLVRPPTLKHVPAVGRYI